MFSIDLTGQVALVTGGARGIGAAIARSLANAGADIAVNYRKPGGPSEKPGQALVEEIKAMGRRAVLIAADVSVKDEAGRLADQAAAELGGLDIVILNAARAPFKPFDRLLERELRSHYGLTVGHFPQSFDIATVGGWVACRGAGQYSTRQPSRHARSPHSASSQ